jgi:diguanylate cyclase (GGDEF)-like protein
MLWKIKHTLYLGFALTGLLAVASDIIARWAHSDEETTRKDIVQTDRTIRDIQHLNFLALEITVMQRGFIISGDVHSLDELPLLRSDFVSTQNSVAAEIGGDSDLAAQYRKYLEFINERRDFVNRVNEVQKNQDFQAAKKLEATGEDDRLFSCMQSQMEAMRIRALARLAAQEAKGHKLQKTIAWTETLNALLTLVLLVWMGSKLAAVTLKYRRLYADLVYRSEFDLLTDIPNRHQFETRLRAVIERAASDGSIFALIFIDLDRFKQINDRFGHHIGDLFLQRAAQRMKRQLRPGDMLARLGGDEFAILLASVPDREHTTEILQRLERRFDAPFSIENFQIQGAASMGIALYPEDGDSADALLQISDMAMYAAKQRNKERWLHLCAEVPESTEVA